jgi:hypothetical protein
MANTDIIKERRLQDDAWKVVTLVDGEAPFDVCLPVGPLLVPPAVWKAKEGLPDPSRIRRRHAARHLARRRRQGRGHRRRHRRLHRDRRAFPEVHRRPRLLHRPPAARAPRLRRRVARLRRHRPRPDLLPQSRRLRCLRARRGQERRRCAGRLRRLPRNLPGRRRPARSRCSADGSPDSVHCRRSRTMLRENDSRSGRPRTGRRRGRKGGRVSLQLLRDVARDYAPVVFANSLGAEDMVLTDMIWREGSTSASSRWIPAACRPRPTN